MTDNDYADENEAFEVWCAERGLSGDEVGSWEQFELGNANS